MKLYGIRNKKTKKPLGICHPHLFDEKVDNIYLVKYKKIAKHALKNDADTMPSVEYPLWEGDIDDPSLIYEVFTVNIDM